MAVWSTCRRSTGGGLDGLRFVGKRRESWKKTYIVYINIYIYSIYIVYTYIYIVYTYIYIQYIYIYISSGAYCSMLVPALS